MSLVAPDNKVFAVGVTNYSSDQVRLISGHRSADIPAILSKSYSTPEKAEGIVVDRSMYKLLMISTSDGMKRSPPPTIRLKAANVPPALSLDRDIPLSEHSLSVCILYNETNLGIVLEVPGNATFSELRFAMLEQLDSVPDNYSFYTRRK